MLARLTSNIAATGIARQSSSKNVKAKRSLGRCKLGSEDNTKMDLNEIIYEGVDCIHLTGEGTEAGSCEHGYE
jgi:hypothetical protein